MTLKYRLTVIREKIWLVIPLLLVLAYVGFASPATDSDKAQADDIEEVNAVLDAFEDAYSNEQLNDLRQLFFAEAVIAFDVAGGDNQRVYNLENWLESTQEYTFDTNDYISDQLTNREVQVFRNIAYVVCDYRYEDENNLGLGVDIFTLMKMRNRWRILSLQFTGEQGSNQ